MARCGTKETALSKTRTSGIRVNGCWRITSGLGRYCRARHRIGCPPPIWGRRVDSKCQEDVSLLTARQRKPAIGFLPISAIAAGRHDLVWNRSARKQPCREQTRLWSGGGYPDRYRAVVVGAPAAACAGCEISKLASRIHAVTAMVTPPIQLSVESIIPGSIANPITPWTA